MESLRLLPLISYPNSVAIRYEKGGFYLEELVENLLASPLSLKEKQCDVEDVWNGYRIHVDFFYFGRVAFLIINYFRGLIKSVLCLITYLWR